MSSRSFIASMLTACVLAVGFAGIAPVTNAASAGPSILKRGESARNYLIEIKRRGRGPRLYVPIAPSYLAYDYPYYYSRGHYPTRIGRGYVYYGYPYSYYTRNYDAKYGRRCSRRCVAKAGYSRGPASLRYQRRVCGCR